MTNHRVWARRLLPLFSLLAAPAAVQACSTADEIVNPAVAGPKDASLDAFSSTDAPAHAQDDAGDAHRDAPAPGLARINHLVVIYLENHSFDNLYGEFPGADGLTGLDASAPTVTQVDDNGAPFATLPPPPGATPDAGDPRFPASLPNAPFAIEQYATSDASTPDLVHRYFTEQRQIDQGKMDKFALLSDAKGLVMGYYRTMNLPIANEAKNGTVCDRFHHAAFGGSFLNHFWLIAARTPEFPNAPAAMKNAAPNDAGFPSDGKDKAVTFDDFVVNTAFSVNAPHPHFPVAAANLVPNQTFDTIGDRLSEKGLTWAWFSGGWTDALAASNEAGVPDGGAQPSEEQFQCHHQPFVYFAKYADGTPAKAEHLQDELAFVAAAKAGTLPAVSFVKPVGIDNEHPGYAAVLRGEQHVMDLIFAVKNGPNWKDTAIVITYDENGGYWDPVAPPKKNKWGPGARVPTVVLSPFARKGFVDHTVYDTTSILATIEHRWGLLPLGPRDTAASDLAAAFDFTQLP